MITKAGLSDFVFDYFVPCFAVACLFLMATFCEISSLTTLALVFLNGLLVCGLVLECCSSIRNRRLIKRMEKSLERVENNLNEEKQHE